MRGRRGRPSLEGSDERDEADGDVPELVPSAGLEAVARAYAKIIDEVNELDLEQLQWP